MTRFYFLPESYQPDEKTMAAAKRLGLTDKQVQEQLEKCQDHQYKRPMIDPDRCFRNWLRNAIKFGDVVPTVQVEYRKPEQLTAEQRSADILKYEQDMRRLRVVK